MPDISLISSMLHLEPGVSMLGMNNSNYINEECGTGSGSFSHSIARTIQPHGHLHTFEYHSDRAELASKEFSVHGFGDLVTVDCRDVCIEGFGIVHKVSAGNSCYHKILIKAFLDLPCPWEAIPHLAITFDEFKIGRVCSFSPCIEQVQLTVDALSAHGYYDIEMYEVLLRSHEVKSLKLAAWTKKPILSRMRPDGTTEKNKKRTAELDEKDIIEQQEIVITKCSPEMRGHTSY